MATTKTKTDVTPEPTDTGATIVDDGATAPVVTPPETTAPETPKASIAVRKVGKQILKDHPDMEVVYMTTDGMAFFALDDAIGHSRAINGGDVIPVKR